MSRDFEVGTNVSCEESTVSPCTGLIVCLIYHRAACILKIVHRSYPYLYFTRIKYPIAKKRNIINKLINLTMNKARQHIERHTEHVTVLTMNTIK